MEPRKSKKSSKPEVQDLQPGAYVELTEAEAEKVEGGVLIGMDNVSQKVLLGDGSVRFHNYKTLGTLGEEQVQ